ncbi:MAG: 1-acyl-sn-glycerol-3-phosphate acyltransferase [Pseudomonadota bacterium]
MSDDSAPLTARTSVFLPDTVRSDLHIADELIQERCPSFVNHWTWPVVRPILYNLLGYTKARRMADHLMELNGEMSFDYLAEELAMDITVDHAERLPETGRCIVAANHPTGLADGIAIWDVLRARRKDIVVFANADAVRVNPRFTDIIIPVEWLMDKRSPAKTRETLRLAAQAFAEEKCVIIFPSGKLAKRIDGTLTEHDWFTTVVGLAKKQSAPIIPVNLKALNSRLYYFFARVNGELRDITLFHELLNKKGAPFHFTFGNAIQPGDLTGPGSVVTEALKDYVAYTLQANPKAPFEK